MIRDESVADRSEILLRQSVGTREGASVGIRDSPVRSSSVTEKAREISSPAVSHYETGAIDRSL